MGQLLIPDSGPLFSLAAGNLLPLLARFRVGLSDIVFEETIARGNGLGASTEAQRLQMYYQQNTAILSVFPTQVGAQFKAARALNPDYQTPSNLGELSIHSLLIELQIKAPGTQSVVLFEVGWFLRNAVALPMPCVLLGTQAFLEYAKERQWITSAADASAAIAAARPGACGASLVRMESIVKPQR